MSDGHISFKSAQEQMAEARAQGWCSKHGFVPCKPGEPCPMRSTDKVMCGRPTWADKRNHTGTTNGAEPAE